MKLRRAFAARPGRRPIRSQLGVFITLLGLMASAILAAGVTRVDAAVVDATPTWPIPTDAPAGPPAIPSMPTATDTPPPPADEIADPVTPLAACGGWYLASSYGDRWAATSTWWEYRCTHSDAQYHNTCAGPACEAFCPSCYWETEEWTDHFFWDGSNARFYGQAYSGSVVYDSDYASSWSYWWDSATARWYGLGPHLLGVSKTGTGSGTISSSLPGISCGDTCQATFDAGTTITLGAVADTSSSFSGWSGDCSGSGSCQVTIDQARFVTATFTLKTFGVTVLKAGSGSGVVTSSPAGISCADTCQATFEAGASVILTAIPDASSIFSGWSGDCSGIGTCGVMADQARSITATFTRNAAPQASFTVACAVLSCSFNGAGSADPDGWIVGYAWDFGDGATGSGQAVSHTYGLARSYTVTLTVTDNGGSTATDSKAVSPISLSARGYKQNGIQNVDLSWNGTSGTSFDVYRNGVRITTVHATSYTDNLNKRGPGSYRYQVCAPGTASCSNEAKVSF